MPTYDALKHAKNRNVLLSEIGLSKAKKRQFKNSERLRIQCLEESGVQSNRFLDTEKEVNNLEFVYTLSIRQETLFKRQTKIIFIK